MALAITCAVLCACQFTVAEQDQQMPTTTGPTVEEKIVVDKIWSAVSVGFALLTHGDRQYLAYYNADRRMVVAQRKLDEDMFEKFILPSESDQPPRRSKKTSTIQGWDSHNYITIAVDSAGHIHLSGNMHVDPLLYFRTTKTHDITTMKQVKSMVGKQEDKCTYPKFTTSPRGDLLFHYRDGWSGNGQEIYNVYDTKTQTWRRFLEKNLISGQGKRNAYQRGPKRGPDGWYHLMWIWRETHHVETCNNLGYARSKDMVNWETADGQKLELPITREDKQTIIDPVPVEGGLHNSHQHFALDSKGRFVATYIKHDASDHTQAYAARFENGKWKIRALSDWKHKHIFKGGGSGPSTFGTSLRIGPATRHAKGQLAMPFRHWVAGDGLIVFDEQTLEPIQVIPMPKKKARFPEELTKVTSDFPGMGVKWRGDSGKSPHADSFYVLRWETLGPNRDRPRKGKLPDNSDLVLYRISKARDGE